MVLRPGLEPRHLTAHAPGLYERALILAPFLDLPPDNFWRPIEPVSATRKASWNAFYANVRLQIQNEIRKIIVKNAPGAIGEDKREVRWVGGCYANNAAGRAGICDTDIRNLADAVLFGENTLIAWRSAALSAMTICEVILAVLIEAS